MSQMTPLMEGNKVIGAVVQRSLVNEYGSVFGREYVVYAAPSHRINPVMEGVEASLRMQGIEANSDNVWGQTHIYWGNRPVGE